MRRYIFKGSEKGWNGDGKIEYGGFNIGSPYYENEKSKDTGVTVSELSVKFPKDWFQLGVPNRYETNIEEQSFINQCAISAMNGLTSNPNIDHQITDVELVTTSFNVAYAMNEERKKRLKT